MSNLITKRGLVEVVAKLFACIIFLIVLGTIISFFILFDFFIPDSFGSVALRILSNLLEIGSTGPFSVYFKTAWILSFLSSRWAYDILFRYSHERATMIVRKIAQIIGILSIFFLYHYLLPLGDVILEDTPHLFRALVTFLLLSFPFLFGLFIHWVIMKFADHLDA